jgi:hypothetical protein
MIPGALHVAVKDLREHRIWLVAFFVVVLLRAMLVGMGMAEDTGHPGLARSLAFLDLALCLLHLGLVVTVAVQIVHADLLVRTTAFWLTRPIPRGSLLVAKLLTASVCLVLIPAVLDGAVLTANRMAWPDVLGAMLEDSILRLTVVLPIMALAAITPDLAVFVVSGLSAFMGGVILEVALSSLKLRPWRSPAATDTVLVVVACLVIIASLAALAHQVLTRRTGRTAGLAVVAGLLILYAGSRWDTRLIGPPEGLEAGWLDPARVVVTMKTLPADRVPFPAGGRSWPVRAAWTASGAPHNVVVVPLGVTSDTTLSDGTRSRYSRTEQLGAWGLVPSALRVLRRPEVESLLGGVRLLDATASSEGAGVWPIASLSHQDFEKFEQHGARFDANVTLGALAYKVGAVLPLNGRDTAAAGDRRIALRSAACSTGSCTVDLVESTASFVVDLRRPSRMIYVLVNRPRRRAFIGAAGVDLGRHQFDQLRFPWLAQHLSVTRMTLKFRAPDDAPALMDPAWLQEASITAIEVRDIGSFTVRATIAAASAHD